MPNHTSPDLGAALREVVGDRPFAPDLDRIEQRGQAMRRRRTAWRATGGGVFAVAAIAAVAVATTGAGGPAPAQPLALPSSSAAASETPLLQLVSHLTTAPQPAGDATLVLRDQHLYDGKVVKVWDLHTDAGPYYFAKTRAGLTTQVKGDHTRGDAAFSRRALAAAKYAATGDLSVAYEKMRVVANPKAPKSGYAPGVAPTHKPLPGTRPVNSDDNKVWNNALDALRLGGGNPQVRAGVLRVLGTLRGIEVAKSTLDGQPVLTITSGSPTTAGPEIMTIDATSGVPLRFGGQDDGYVEYTMTRVTLAKVAEGNF